MAGTNIVNQIQLGDSATATNNFVIKTNVDGSGKLSRGNVGATTQDILTWDASGKVSYPQNLVPAFSATGSNSGLSNGTVTKASVTTERFDTNANYDAPNSKFLPTVAGYYQCNCSMSGGGGTNTTGGGIELRKNGTLEIPGNSLTSWSSAGGGISASASGVIFLNGSTDYVESYLFLQGTGTLSSTNYFSATLVRAA